MKHYKRFGFHYYWLQDFQGYYRVKNNCSNYARRGKFNRNITKVVKIFKRTGLFPF
jgi:hypothetical protein